MTPSGQEVRPFIEDAINAVLSLKQHNHRHDDIDAIVSTMRIAADIHDLDSARSGWRAHELLVVVYLALSTIKVGDAIKEALADATSVLTDSIAERLCIDDAAASIKAKVKRKAKKAGENNHAPF